MKQHCTSLQTICSKFNWHYHNFGDLFKKLDELCYKLGMNNSSVNLGSFSTGQKMAFVIFNRFKRTFQNGKCVALDLRGNTISYSMSIGPDAFSNAPVNHGF